MTSTAATESILEPELAIIDPHHHLWDWPDAVFANAPVPQHGFETVTRRAMRYLLPEFLADLNSGHNILGTVYVQCGAMHRAQGPEAFKPVGETEFANGVAAMCASGIYGPVRACAGIVGHVDLTAGTAVREVLEAHLQAGGERFRGIRHTASYDADSNVLGPLVRAGAGLFMGKAFRQGYAQLATFNLSFDACIEFFGVNRCMFESNFPVDMGSCTYPVLWNAFKTLAKNYSAAEKAALFSGTARRVYRLTI